MQAMSRFETLLMSAFDVQDTTQSDVIWWIVDAFWWAYAINQDQDASIPLSFIIFMMKIMMAFGVEWHFSYFADEKPWKHEKISSVDMEIQLKLAISFITEEKMWIKMYFLAFFFSYRSKKSLKQLFMKNKSNDLRRAL